MVICLYGASSHNIHPDYFSGVEALGRALGQRGHTLLFGGGDKGLMGAAARGVKASNGRVIGVAPRFFNVDGVLFPHCDEFFYTDTMRERKQILEDKADAFLAVPGGIGTFDELFEILTLRQLGRHSKPVVLFNLRGYFDPLLAMLDKAIEDGFMKEECRTLWAAFTDASALLDYLEQYKGEIGFFKEVDHDQSV
ncbi:MAG: TIGR00730 family Rossman fold protein [Clostridia bacterium]|nr:TIGR00730 family Rossman fold protein [Clostridia bacterium]